MKVAIDSLHALKPGTYDFIMPGQGKPQRGLPSKCLHCRKPIKAGETWRAHSNGEYTVIFHSACEAASK